MIVWNHHLLRYLKVYRRNCNDYEKYTQQQKDGINLDAIQKHMNTLTIDNKFIDDELLDKYQREMDNFTEFKIEYYDENDDQIKFASSKDE